MNMELKQLVQLQELDGRGCGTLTCLERRHLPCSLPEICKLAHARLNKHDEEECGRVCDKGVRFIIRIKVDEHVSDELL